MVFGYSWREEREEEGNKIKVNSRKRRMGLEGT